MLKDIWRVSLSSVSSSTGSTRCCIVSLVLQERKAVLTSIPILVNSLLSPHYFRTSSVSSRSLLLFSPECSPSGLYHQSPPEAVLVKVSPGFLCCQVKWSFSVFTLLKISIALDIQLFTLFSVKLFLFLALKIPHLPCFPPTFVNAPSQSFCDPSTPHHPVSPHVLIF